MGNLRRPRCAGIYPETLQPARAAKRILLFRAQILGQGGPRRRSRHIRRFPAGHSRNDRRPRKRVRPEPVSQRSRQGSRSNGQAERSRSRDGDGRPPIDGHGENQSPVRARSPEPSGRRSETIPHRAARQRLVGIRSCRGHHLACRTRLSRHFPRRPECVGRKFHESKSDGGL